MNTKMKKAVAGVVLGTFAFGVATPAFAEASVPETEAVVVNQVYATEVTAAVGNSEYEVEPTGAGGVALKVVKQVKNLIDANWTKITTFMIKYNVEIEMIQQLDELKSTFFDAIDSVAGFSDDVNDMLQNALMSIGFSESVAGVMADVICIVIL